MANAEHLAKLKEGVEVWNQWRRENLGVPPDLIGADLRGATLTGADLRGALLRGASLNLAILTEAILTEADLIGDCYETLWVGPNR